WHVFVRGCGPGVHYAFRIDGPRDPSAGQRFNPNKVLISPFARRISRALLKRPMEASIIYELHVGGFTRSASSRVARPGTFAGVIEKIPYLQALGVTAVELLPIFEFDDATNYWGYSTVGFFSPHSGYCDGPNDFRDMVKALHRAGIEVILDVVFNHTDEGNEFGPTESFRGIDNRTFYL